MKRVETTALLVVFMLLTSACGGALSLTSADTPTATYTFTPELPQTPMPTATLKPTATLEPTNTPFVCDADSLLKGLKTMVPYDEFAVHYNEIEGTRSLLVWFVDPEINPTATGGEIQANLDMALTHAAELSQKIRVQFPCVTELFDVINPIVVDQKYTGWFSGTLDPTIIPDEEALTSAEIDQLVDKFTVGYLLEALPGPIPAGSCNWSSVRESMQNHFSPERQNVAFYFVVDDFGANVWAQWDGPTDPIFMMTSLMNVMMELDCFIPTANLIFIVVDKEGTTGLVGVVPQGDAGSMQIVYER